MFLARLKREERLYEFFERVAHYKRLPRGEKPHSCKMQAMYDLGYRGPADERRRHQRWLRDGKMLPHQLKIARRRRESVEYARMKKYTQAFDALPNTAPMSVVLDWVQSHPKLFQALQKRQEPDADGNMPLIRLTANDLENATNGPCPSKTAAIKLAHALRDPESWQAKQHTSDKKASEKETGAPKTGPNRRFVDDREELDRLLAAAESDEEDVVA